MRAWILAVVLTLTACSQPAPPAGSLDLPSPSRSSTARTRPAPSAQPIPATRAQVVRHIDGDTFEVVVAGRTESVRFIGVDTPERGTSFFGEASAFTARAAPVGSTVWLELDVEERDRYGRMLAYVWLRELAARSQARARMLNARLVARGWAQILTIPPNVAYADLFVELQQRARRREVGLWAGLPGSGACDPSYPDVCIPPPPPDLDCGHITHRNFRVIGADPHSFDGDGNGRGCES